MQDVARGRSALPGWFLSRRCFMLCITVEVEPRIAKQWKCQYCCSCKNYRGKGMEGGKKVFEFTFFKFVFVFLESRSRALISIFCTQHWNCVIGTRNAWGQKSSPVNNEVSWSRNVSWSLCFYCLWLDRGMFCFFTLSHGTVQRHIVVFGDAISELCNSKYCRRKKSCWW